MPRDTAPGKIREIEALGGRCPLVDSASDTHVHAAVLAGDLHGLFLDQFANAERVTDWRGKVLEDRLGERRVVLSPEVAYVMTDLMKGVVREGTGTAANWRTVRRSRWPARA